MPEIKCYFKKDETIINSIDLSPVTAVKSTTKSTRSLIYDYSNKYIGDLSMHFNGISIRSDTDRSRSGKININLKEPEFNISLDYSSVGIYPNITEPGSIAGVDYNNVPTNVSFVKEDNTYHITIFQN